MLSKVTSTPSLTFLCVVYNEEARIRDVMRHASQWADHIVVIDKSSTDRTAAIAADFANVEVVRVPYSEAGDDDFVRWVGIPKDDWIFIGTASEVPTRKLIELVRETISNRDGEIDLVFVPRRMYSFGINHQDSPWYVSDYPFCIDRRRAVVRNVIHHNFSATAIERTAKIPYSEDCCVYHLTHVSAESYLRTMTQYFRSEAATSRDFVNEVDDCFLEIARWEKRIRKSDPELLIHYCAWSVYQLGKIMFLWEKERGLDLSAYYSALRRQMISREWESSDERPPSLNGRPLYYEYRYPLGFQLRPQNEWLKTLHRLVKGFAKRFMFWRGRE